MLSKNDIEKYLEQVNEKLKQRKQYGEIVMAGGASLTLIFNARESTHDIDALFRPSREFREIITEIANENNLQEDWLNDGVKGFFTEKMKADLFKNYSNLSVYSINAEGLLALKLTSARQEAKDLEDSIVLMKHLGIEKEEELFDIVEKYTSKNQQTPKCYYFTKEAYSQYAKEKKESVSVMNMNEWKSKFLQENKKEKNLNVNSIQRDKEL